MPYGIVRRNIANLSLSVNMTQAVSKQCIGYVSSSAGTPSPIWRDPRQELQAREDPLRKKRGHALDAHLVPGQDAGEMLLNIEARIGELISTTVVQGKTKAKSPDAIILSDLKMKQTASHNAQAIHRNPAAVKAIIRKGTSRTRAAHGHVPPGRDPFRGRDEPAAITTTRGGTEKPTGRSI